MKHTLLSLVLVLIFSFSAFANECVSGDCVNGYGTYVWDSGEKYVGEFKNYEFHGQGTLTLADGNWYVGEFKNYKFDGQGTYTSANGDKYVGGFKNNEKHGQGTYTYASASGGVWRGIWENGELARMN